MTREGGPSDVMFRIKTVESSGRFLEQLLKLRIETRNQFVLLGSRPTFELFLSLYGRLCIWELFAINKVNSVVSVREGATEKVGLVLRNSLLKIRCNAYIKAASVLARHYVNPKAVLHILTL